MSREPRTIDLRDDGEEPSDLSSLLVASPETLWRAWIEKIVRDPEMDRDRIMRHLQAHIGQHMPNEDAPRERWEEWLAGSYNLLAILSTAVGINPHFAVGNELLLRKWLSAPTDHTPPPATVRPTQWRQRWDEPRDNSGS